MTLLVCISRKVRVSRLSWVQEWWHVSLRHPWQWLLMTHKIVLTWTEMDPTIWWSWRMMSRTGGSQSMCRSRFLYSVIKNCIDKKAILINSVLHPLCELYYWCKIDVWCLLCCVLSCRALKALNGYSSGPASHLISVFFGYSEPGTISHQRKKISCRLKYRTIFTSYSLTCWRCSWLVSVCLKYFFIKQLQMRWNLATLG